MSNDDEMTDDEIDQLPLSDLILMMLESTVSFLEGLPGRRRVFTPQLRREIAAHARGLRAVLVKLQEVDAASKCEHDWLFGKCTKCDTPEP